MAYYLPHGHDAFGELSGVGKTKLEQFADEFLPLIVEYADQRGLSQRDRPARRRSLSNARRSPSASLKETKRLFAGGLGVEEIGLARDLAVSTIFGHLERIARSEPDFDIARLMPSPDRVETIGAALRSHDSGALAPVKEALGDDYSYGEIRLVRLQMERNFENRESADSRF